MAIFNKLSNSSKVKSMVVRPITNLGDYHDKDFPVAPDKFGLKQSIIDKTSFIFENAKEIADIKDAICIAFFNDEDDNKFAICERDEESGIIKFVLFNAVETSEGESTLHAVSRRSQNDPIRWEKYLKFEKGSLA